MNSNINQFKGVLPIKSFKTFRKNREFKLNLKKKIGKKILQEFLQGILDKENLSLNRPKTDIIHLIIRKCLEFYQIFIEIKFMNVKRYI